MVSFSVIVPTCGRPSLEATLRSAATQLRAPDQLLIVADGVQPYARGLARMAQEWTSAHVLYTEVIVPGSHYGNGQRDVGIRLAHASHLLFIDDDDVYEPGALAAVREAVEASPHAVHVFKARWGAGHHAAGVELWKQQEFVEQNVATPMCVWPRTRDLPAWMETNGRGVLSDFGWMGAALGIRRLRWHEPVICTVRPVTR